MWKVRSKPDLSWRTTDSEMIKIVSRKIETTQAPKYWDGQTLTVGH